MDGSTLFLMVMTIIGIIWVNTIKTKHNKYKKL